VGKKLYVNKEQMAKAADLDGYEAKHLWKVFSPEPEGVIYYSEFAQGIHEVERGLTDTVNEIENRKFIGKIIRVIIMVVLWSLGWTIAMQAINLDITTLVQALALLTVAATLAMSSLFGRFLTAFVFLLFSHPYYKNDLVNAGGETFVVRKITLLNTYGMTPAGQWLMIDNPSIAMSKITNFSRSLDCVFAYENAVHAETSKATIDSWRRTITAFIKSKPEIFRDFEFNVISVNGDNKLNIEMKAYVRGATWAHPELYNPIREKLWIHVHQAAIQLGIYAAPTVPETDLVTIVDKEDKKDDKLVEKSSSKRDKKERSASQKDM